MNCGFVTTHRDAAVDGPDDSEEPLLTVGGELNGTFDGINQPTQDGVGGGPAGITFLHLLLGGGLLPPQGIINGIVGTNISFISLTSSKLPN